MAKEAPNSFRDPYWSDLAGTVEAKLDLPKGLLSSIVTNGERSNADQVSEAGAKTPFQIIPATRKAAIDKYGVDPYLSPENAAEVAGRLLKDSLDRNKGDASLAVAEYIGGTDRKNWGPTTKAYVQRVTGGMPSVTTELPTDTTDSAGAPQSTFDRVSAQMQPAPSAMAGTLSAYKNGQMAPEDAAKFEAQVKAGRVMLPNGVTLNDAPASAGQSAGRALPPSVLGAYSSGKMSEDDRQKLEKMASDGQVQIPSGVQYGMGSAAKIPVNAAGDLPGRVAAPVAAPQDNLLGKVAGPFDAAATVVSGGLASIPGAAVELFQGPDAARSFMQSATHQPQTQTGSDIAESISNAAHVVGLEALPGMGGELAALGRASAPLSQALSDAGRSSAVPVVNTLKAAQSGISSGAAKAGAAVRGIMPGAEAASPTAGTLGSAGAAATDLALQREATAAALPVPIKLTKGQATRDFEQQRFEQETAKEPSTSGQRLRENAADQNAKVPQNFEAMIDESGARAASNIETGRAVVDEGLVKQAAKDKAEYRVKYARAEKAGEMEEPVSTQPVVDFLRENESFASGDLAPSLVLAKKELVRLGGADVVDGQLVPRDIPLKQAELLRRQINSSINADVTNGTNMRLGVQLKGVIDQATEGLGGQLYKDARKARQRYSQLYEDNAIVSDLLKTRKGTSDRKIALEDVFNKTILSGSREDLSKLRRTLHVSGGEAGSQAWRELQGATVRHLLDEATKGVGTDIRGNPIVSAAKLNNAVRSLEEGGKLDFILGKNGAQQVRDLNEISKVIYTAPPGTVNTSNTASVILAALAEMGTTGAITGLPVPVLSGLRVASKYVKDRRVAQRVNEALSGHKKIF